MITDWPQDFGAMKDVINAFLVVYAALFPIVDPVGPLRSLRA
jgi:hypothetical protein